MELLLDTQNFFRTGSIVKSGKSFVCKRVFRNSIIQLKNVGNQNAVVAIVWLDSLEQEVTESETILTVVPGATFQFESARNKSQPTFLDALAVEHLDGAEIEVSYLVPKELFN